MYELRSSPLGLQPKMMPGIGRAKDMRSSPPSARMIPPRIGGVNCQRTRRRNQRGRNQAISKWHPQQLAYQPNEDMTCSTQTAPSRPHAIPYDLSIITPLHAISHFFLFFYFLFATTKRMHSTAFPRRHQQHGVTSPSTRCRDTFYDHAQIPSSSSSLGVNAVARCNTFMDAGNDGVGRMALHTFFVLS